MKRLFFLAVAFFSHLAWADFSQCQEHFFQEKLIIRKTSETQYELCNKGYAVLYDGLKKIPIYAFAHVTPEELDGALKLSRKNIEFMDDERVLPEHRSQPDDYLKSGFDRGHMIGNAFFGDKVSQIESFLMTNISPQLPQLNRDVFAKVEADTRKYIRRTRHPVYMIVGVTTQYDECRVQVKNQVCVIDNLWMAIVDPLNGKSWAHWLHNAGDTKLLKPITIKNLEGRLGQSVFPLIKKKPIKKL